MIEVDKCRLEPDKDKRVAQILATDVTREQLAEAVWAMERIHATQHDLIMELMNRNAKLRELVETMLSCPTHEDDCEACKKLNGTCEVEAMMRELGIEVDS